VTTRALFFEADDARSVAALLEDAGFGTTLSRERFAGEDDDEDHPWLLATEAPAARVRPLAEQHDGWLDEEPADPPPDRPPVELPDRPRRVKGQRRDP
jgi:hypothetical protein